MVIRLVLLLVLMTGVARAESLRLVVPDGQPVVGEMIPLTVRGEYTRQITLEKLSFPNSEDYDWMQLSRDQWRDEQIEGRSVRVFERRIALFPRHAGALAIGPVAHHLTVVGANNLREPLVVTAPPVTLPVAPFPDAGAPLSARSLTIEDELSAKPGELRDGETLVRRVTLKAEGTLPHLLPARPLLREPWLISFVAPERREMQPTPDGPVTTVSWEWHLRPKTGEPGVLPAVSIPWFDTAARQMRTAEMPAIPFGYSSFGGNRSGTERLPAAQVGLAWFATGMGLMAGLAFALIGLSPSRRADMLRAIRRLSPIDPTRRALVRAARTGALLDIRRAAETYLRRRRSLGLPVSGRETAQLDEQLYGRNAATSSVTAKVELEAMFRHG
ncbi:BatD family protein [Ancylobacter defluvii]|uniref:Oxygen tolerance protein BatD n=1 Tax=Ancylobacter defluvii TaxID=1282440 RepID=A0A9W6JWG1_9HYPH|nr:BatD family protein [Ancylobacter defluvii]MBS7588561.1 BatD family protein [Ancylobacter defluvii]GLK83841.1 hypothetical protein GCM10017653_19110 [Ancylobacter defluvii]